jgi:pimeloyl-ACP methyl ester carboxylesterase
MKSPLHTADLQIFAGRTIGVPSLFIAGRSDWGVFQRPGDFEAMQAHACSDLRGCHLIEGAGHWVQQEQPGAVNALLLDFLQRQ